MRRVFRMQYCGYAMPQYRNAPLLVLGVLTRSGHYPGDTCTGDATLLSTGELVMVDAVFYSWSWSIVELKEL